MERPASLIALEEHWEATARKHTCLLGWNAGKSIPDPLTDNGTCCLVQACSARFAVTCEHVWQGYEIFKSANPGSRLWISLVKNDQCFTPSYAQMLSNPRAIAVNKSLDLAVFTFDQITALEPWRFHQYQSPSREKAKKGDIVHFLGFPGEAVRAGAGERNLNYCFSSDVIHDASHSRFMLHSAPGTIHHENQVGESCAAFRICGASGAPVFKVCQNFELALAGVVSALSSSGLGDAATARYEMSDGDIYVTHACFIQEDGSIMES